MNWFACISGGFRRDDALVRVLDFRKEEHRMEVFYMRATEDYIKLGQVLKAAGLVESGAEAKQAVQDGSVRVNGEVDTRRGRKLYDGDFVEYSGKELKIAVKNKGIQESQKTN